jgi:predicted transcriptional regulator
MEYNRIYKPKKFDNFTIVPSNIFRHKNISIGATGLYCWMFSHSSKQIITTEFICGHFKQGRDTIRKRLNELIKCGYLKRVKITKKGKFVGTNYYLNEIPHIENPDMENPSMEKSTQSNIIYNNIDIYISNISNTLLKSYKYFIDLFPDRYKPKTKTQLSNWIVCLDKIERIDKYNLNDVYLAVKYIREDDFWKNNFFTILKLRNQDKNGIKFIHRFMDMYKSNYEKRKNI